MKRNLIIAGIATIMLTNGASFANTTPTLQDNSTPQVEKTCTCKKNKPVKPKFNLDEKLKLTEEQKKQAHDIRMDGHKKIKPVFEKIKTTNEEIKKVHESDLSAEQKDKKICALEKELLTLKQQARRIRIENTKQFEAILTPEQKTEFENMKKEFKKRPMPKHKGKNFDRPFNPQIPKPINK